MPGGIRFRGVLDKKALTILLPPLTECSEFGDAES